MDDARATSDRTYVLGSTAPNLERLDRQARSIERATQLILNAAGIARGERALDLGTGLGHVARMVGQLVGPTGSVIGIDQSAEALAVARQRVEHAHETHVSFVEGNVADWSAADPFDVIVARLLLFHCADPVAVVRHHMKNLRAGGSFVAIDFDLGGAGTDPPVAVVDDAIRWVREAFSAAGASPRIGARLGLILEQSELQGVTTFGIQPYLSPSDPSGAALLSGVVRSVSSEIIRHRIATADELALETLEERISEATRRAQAVVLLPTVVGAWGRRSNT